MPTGIAGFDELLGGGVPRNRTTLISGGPGCGKTVFALEALVHGARDFGEPGIFVVFEESAERVIANSASFGWDLPALRSNKLCFLDARLPRSSIQNGEFDLLGVLARLDVKRRELGVRRIVFDGLDMLLGMFLDRMAEQREVYYLSDWLAKRKLTGLITCKASQGSDRFAERSAYLEYLADCVVKLDNFTVESLPVRQLRITKCRGLAHTSQEVPVTITSRGFRVGNDQSLASRRELEPTASLADTKSRLLDLQKQVVRAEADLASFRKDASLAGRRAQRLSAAAGGLQRPDAPASNPRKRSRSAGPAG